MVLYTQPQPLRYTVDTRVCVACHHTFRTQYPGPHPCPSCGQRLTLVRDSYTTTAAEAAARAS